MRGLAGDERRSCRPARSVGCPLLTLELSRSPRVAASVCDGKPVEGRDVGAVAADGVEVVGGVSAGQAADVADPLSLAIASHVGMVKVWWKTRGRRDLTSRALAELLERRLNEQPESC